VKVHSIFYNVKIPLTEFMREEWPGDIIIPRKRWRT